MFKFLKVLVFCCMFSGVVFAGNDPKDVIKNHYKMTSSEIKFCLGELSDADKYGKDPEVLEFVLSNLVEYFKNPIGESNKIGKVIYEEIFVPNNDYDLGESVYRHAVNELPKYIQTIVGEQYVIERMMVMYNAFKDDRETMNLLAKFADAITQKEREDFLAGHQKFLEEQGAIAEQNLKEAEEAKRVESSIKYYVTGSSNANIPSAQLAKGFVNKVSRQLNDGHSKNAAISMLLNPDTQKFFDKVYVNKGLSNALVIFKKTYTDYRNGALDFVAQKSLLNIEQTLRKSIR